MTSAPAQPFLPYGQQDLDESDLAAVMEALRSPYLTTGPGVEAFERAVAARVGRGSAWRSPTGPPPSTPCTTRSGWGRATRWWCPR